MVSPGEFIRSEKQGGWADEQIEGANAVENTKTQGAGRDEGGERGEG